LKNNYYRNRMLYLIALIIVLLFGCKNGKVTITLSPKTATVGLGQTKQFQATVTPSKTQVTWTVDEGDAWGTIGEDGIYIAPDLLPSPPIATVRVSSISDPAVSATAKVTITEGGGSSTTTTTPDLPGDEDGDGTPNATDNCPATANSDQADANHNGIGDACEEPSNRRYAIVTSEGVVEATFDDCLRPAGIIGPDHSASITWSSMADTVVVTVTEGGSTSSVTAPVDWSENAIAGAWDAYEDSTGRDLTTLRNWLTAHPELLQQLATCQAGNAAKLVIQLQSQNSDDWETLGDYFSHLAEMSLGYAGITEELERETIRQLGSIPPGFQKMLGRIGMLEDNLEKDLEDELHECVPCSSDCNIDCSGYGACIRGDRCDEQREADCLAAGGRFFAHSTCNYACCATAIQTGYTRCDDLPVESCILIDLDDGVVAIPHYGHHCSSLYGTLSVCEVKN